MIRLITIVLAVAGVCVGVWAVTVSKQEKPVLALARPPSVNPFPNGVAALGFVEARGRNVNIAAPEAGLVTGVLADVGDAVKAGQPLLQLDTRSLEAELVRAEAAVRAGESEIARWRSLPRAEDVPPLEAAVARAQAQVNDREEQYRLTAQAQLRGAATSRDESSSRFALEAAKAEAARAQADLAKVKAGGWQADYAVLAANVESARAQAGSLRVLIERLTVKAPRDGVILRRQIEPGEYTAPSGFAGSAPALILGDLSRLNVRAQVDEEDIALVAASAKAVCRTRGAFTREIALRLVRIEPFARPKSDLSGANAERTDTRIIDVVFEMDGVAGGGAGGDAGSATPGGPSLYPGQAVDVFIDAAARDERGRAGL